MTWKIYDADGNLINTIVGSESYVQSYCERNGYTYELVQTTPPTPTLTDAQQSLIDEFTQTQSRIIAFIQDHSWATTRETFEFATRQYNALVDLYLVLADRIRYEELESYVTMD